MKLNGSIRLVSAFVAFSVITFFSACSNYQEEFDNNFGALEYADDEGESSPSGGDDPQSSPSGDNDSLSSSVPTSSGGIQSSSSTVPLVEGNSLNDVRDGKKYKLVTIGEQKWMAENLNFETEGSRCYDNVNGNCLKYGRLYTWADAQSVCPEGTHLPSYDEFNALYKYVRKEQQSNGTTEAKFLKSKEGWKDYNGKKGGDDTYGFSALPAGLFADTGYVRIGEFARFLTSDTTDDGFVRAFGMDYNNTVFGPSRYTKTYAISVRCLVGEAQPKSSASSSSSQVEQSSSSVKSSSSSLSSSSSVKSSSSSQSSSSSAKSSSSSGFGSSGNFEYEIDGTTFTSSYVKYNGLIWMNQALERKDVGRCHGNDVICGSFSYFSWEDAQTACPAGWRLPTSDEFNKSVDLENASSFKSSGALNGYFLYKWWHKKGEEGMYWTSTYSGDYADVISFKKDVEKGRIVQVNKSFGSASLALSIRCVKNGGEITNNGASRNSSPSISISQDTIRGALYTTVTIGSQTWMAENLDYIAEGNKSRCYDNVRGYNSCDQNGNFYRYEAALGFNNNCSATGNPWVFATEEDVQTLITAVGGVEKLASVGMGGTNESEFTIYASGHYSYAGDNFVPAAASEYASCFWLWDSDNGVDTKAAAYCLKTSGGAVIGEKALIDMNEAHSVRFIRSKDCK